MELFKGLFDTELIQVISLTDFFLCLGTALLSGLIIALCYMIRTRYTKSFVVTLALLPAVVCVVIMMVNGNVGAGMGATVGKIYGADRAMKSGLGCYAVQVGTLQVAAIVVVNAIGDVFELDSQRELAGLLNKDKTAMIESETEAVKLLQMASMLSLNTTIGTIITNAGLDKAEMNKVAAMASNGIARTIRPVNTSMDGDSVYAMSVGKVKSSADVVGTLAAHVMGKAVNRAVLETEEKYGYKSAQSFLK